MLQQRAVTREHRL